MRRPSKRGNADDGRRGDNATKILNPTAFNVESERAFVELIHGLIDEGPLTIDEALQEAAYELDISIETAKRRLKKYTARRADFVLVGDRVKRRAIRGQG